MSGFSYKLNNDDKYIVSIKRKFQAPIPNQLQACPIEGAFHYLTKNRKRYMTHVDGILLDWNISKIRLKTELFPPFQPTVMIKGEFLTLKVEKGDKMTAIVVEVRSPFVIASYYDNFVVKIDGSSNEEIAASPGDRVEFVYVSYELENDLPAIYGIEPVFSTVSEPDRLIDEHETYNNTQDNESGTVQDNETEAVQNNETGAVQDNETGAVHDNEIGAVRVNETGVVLDNDTGVSDDIITGVAQDNQSGVAQENQNVGAQELQSGASQDSQNGAENDVGNNPADDRSAQLKRKRDSSFEKRSAKKTSQVESRREIIQHQGNQTQSTQCNKLPRLRVRPIESMQEDTSGSRNSNIAPIEITELIPKVKDVLVADVPDRNLPDNDNPGLTDKENSGAIDNDESEIKPDILELDDKNEIPEAIENDEMENTSGHRRLSIERDDLMCVVECNSNDLEMDIKSEPNTPRSLRSQSNQSSQSASFTQSTQDSNSSQPLASSQSSQLTHLFSLRLRNSQTSTPLCSPTRNRSPEKQSQSQRTDAQCKELPPGWSRIRHKAVSGKIWYTYKSPLGEIFKNFRDTWKYHNSMIQANMQDTIDETSNSAIDEASNIVTIPTASDFQKALDRIMSEVNPKDEDFKQTLSDILNKDDTPTKENNKTIQNNREIFIDLSGEDEMEKDNDISGGYPSQLIEL